MEFTNDLHYDHYLFLQKTGSAIADVFDQMLKGTWVDSEGHAVPMNSAMLRLKGVLEDAIEFNNKHYIKD